MALRLEPLHPLFAAEASGVDLRRPPEGGLARDDLRMLHAVLHELAECRKLIDAVATREN